MTQPRTRLISLDSTPYYHCMARCVRRAFLCGRDEFAGKDYEHRRQWVVDRLRQLAGVFCIDICAYAVMSNHYHVVLRADRDLASSLRDEEVVERWTQLFQGPPLIQRQLAGEVSSDAAQAVVDDVIAGWRQRLCDISWFMRCLNEHLARLANAEDGCTGRFWEGRFKSQALLDEAALLACMAYVDLNPIRARMAKTPETSDHTSIQERLLAAADARQSRQAPARCQPAWLSHFTASLHQGATAAALPFRLADYFDLVDWTGRVIRPDKRGHIPASLPPMLQRLAMDGATWLQTVQQYRKPRRIAFGGGAALRHYCDHLGQRWIAGGAPGSMA